MNKSASTSQIAQSQNRPSEDGSVFLYCFIEAVCTGFQVERLDIHAFGNLVFSWRQTESAGTTTAGELWSPPYSDQGTPPHFLTWFRIPQDQRRQDEWHGILANLAGRLVPHLDSMQASARHGDLCPSVESILPLLRRYALSDALVAICGESGTGKTYLAQLLHRLSGRQDAPMYINLAAIPETLLEVELFGHAPGAFTDGGVSRPGKLAAAGDGTLIFENIESIDIHSQSILCSILRDRSYYPLAATEPMKLAARIIVTSRIGLEELRAGKRISDELYFLVNVLPLSLAPLRQRHEDIIYFIGTFISAASAKYKVSYRYDRNFIEDMMAHSWNGNIHELMACLELYRVNGKGGVLAGVPPGTGVSIQKDLKESVNLYKRKLIHDIVLRCGGNQTRAAQILGIQRTYLSRLIKELSIYEDSGEGNGKSNENKHS